MNPIDIRILSYTVVFGAFSIAVFWTAVRFVLRHYARRGDEISRRMKQSACREYSRRMRRENAIIDEWKAVGR